MISYNRWNIASKTTGIHHIIELQFTHDVMNISKYVIIKNQNEINGKSKFLESSDWTGFPQTTEIVFIPVETAVAVHRMWNNDYVSWHVSLMVSKHRQKTTLMRSFWEWANTMQFSNILPHYWGS